MSRKKKEIQKIVLFNSIVTDEELEYARENLEQNHMEVTEETIFEEAYERKDWDYDDLKAEFNTISTNGKIIAIVDCGLWNGRVTRTATFNYLADIFMLFAEYDDCEIYLDDKDLRAVGHHHDGTNYILIRSFKEKITEEQEDNFKSLFYSTDEVNKYQLGYYTESVKPMIDKHFGF